MGTFAIGDIQGCHQELNDLLDRINFDERRDRLWFTGDLVNRGPDSLEVLRFVKKLNAEVVLGNHDLHLLAIASGGAQKRKTDTLDAILAAEDKNELLAWLQQRPFLYHDDELGFTLIHAGLPPQWNLAQAISCAREVEEMLAGVQAVDFFANMYGNHPDHWSDGLKGWDRLRFITNCFTRLRYCDSEGQLMLDENGSPGTQPSPYLPWFEIDSRRSSDMKIIFGHWASIYHGNIKNFEIFNVYPLDTGCIWGGELTALRLEDEKYFKVPSRGGAVKSYRDKL